MMIIMIFREIINNKYDIDGRIYTLCYKQLKNICNKN